MSEETAKKKTPMRSILAQFMSLPASERLDWIAHVITATNKHPAWSKVLVEAGNVKPKPGKKPRGERVLAALAANAWHYKKLQNEGAS